MNEKIFFTSDLHFGHTNVIRFDGRPFQNAEEMDAELTRRWNDKASDNDTVYVLGDLIWKSSANRAEEIIGRLNGKIVLIKGNHDSFLHNVRARELFTAVKDYDDICVTLNDGSKRRCILSHYFIPFYVGQKYGAIHLHGHSHNTKEAEEERRIVADLKTRGYSPNVYNVGCMYYDYAPVTLDEILGKKERKDSL